MSTNLKRFWFLAISLIAFFQPRLDAQTDDTLSLITPDALAMVSIRPAHIAQSKSMQRAPLEVITAAGLEYLGLDPLKIERLDLVTGIPIPGPGGFPIALSITHGEPIDKAVLDRFLPGGPTKEKGVDLWNIPETPEFVLGLKNDRQAIVGPKNQVLRLIKTSPGDGELRKLVSNLGTDAAFQIVVAVEPLRELLVESAQSPMLDTIPGLVSNLTVVAKTARQLAMRIETGETPKATYMIEGITPSDSTELAQALKNLIRLGMKFGLASMEQQLSVEPGKTPAATLAYLRRLSQEIESHLDFQPNGNRLAVVVEGQAMIVAQVGIVVGLLLPAVQASREAARRVSGANNMKQILLAMLNYEATYRELPGNAGPKKGDKPNLSWRVHLLPYMEELALYNEFRMDEPWDSPHNIKLLDRMPAVFRDPRSQAPAGHTVYQMPSGTNMILENDKRRRLAHVVDGLSNTIALMVTKDQAAVPWTKPQDFDPVVDRDSIVVHGDRITIGMMDGSVMQLSSEIPTEALEIMLTINDGKVVDEQYYK